MKADALARGVGGKLYTRPIYPEVTGSDIRFYERDPRKIAVLRIEFASEKVAPTAISRVIASLNVRQPVSFEAIGTPKGIVHQVVCQMGQQALVVDRIRSEFGNTAVEAIVPKSESLYSFLDPLRRSKQRPAFAFHDYYLPEPYIIPLEHLGSGTAGIYDVLGRVEGEKDCLAMWQLLVVPAHGAWISQARAYLNQELIDTRTSKSTGNLVESRHHPELADDLVLQFKHALKKKAAGSLYVVCLRTCAFGYGGLEKRLVLGLDSCLKGFQRAYDGYGFRSLCGDDYDAKGLSWEEQLHALKNRVTFSEGIVLMANEVAALVPVPPTPVIEDRSYNIIRTRRSQPVPEDLSRSGVKIGVNSHRGVERPVLLPAEVRNRHVYLIGKTRMGKSSLMLNMIAQDMENGEGISVFDPEGDLIDDVLDWVPESRHKDVVVLDVGDKEYAMGFNALHAGASRSKAARNNNMDK